VAGVPLSSMANWYAKATTDHNTYSAASAVANTITPTFLPAAGNVIAGTAGYGQAGAEFIPSSDKLYSAAEEAARNTDPLVANVAIGTAYKILNASKVGILESVPAPGVPEGVKVLRISTTGLRVKCEFSTVTSGFEVYRADTETGSYSLIATLTDRTYYDDLSLSADTGKWYKMRAYNGTGYSAFSVPVFGRTFGLSTKQSDLLDAIKAKIQAVEGMVSANVIIGTYDDLDQRAKQSPTTSFPCVEILADSDKATQYVSGRDMECVYRYMVFIHAYDGANTREGGVPYNAIDLIANKIRAALYGIQDDEQDGNPPCDGFEMPLGDYSKDLFYESFSEKVNTAIINIGYQVITSDTEI